MNNDSRTAGFRATRKQHRYEAAEDYTELVADLIEKKGSARVGDIAACLGISHVTALRTIGRLVRDGFLKKPVRHSPVELTLKGRRTALIARRRHELILRFLRSIGVPERIAKIDAEGIEHHISAETLRAMKRHIQRLERRD